MRRPFTVTTLLMILTLGGCSGEGGDASEVSDRERLEAVGNSGLPGADGINRALEASDQLDARAQAHDTIR